MNEDEEEGGFSELVVGVLVWALIVLTMVGIVL